MIKNINDEFGLPFKVTDVQIFGDYPDTFSANIAINDLFMIQRGTDGSYSIPRGDLACWDNKFDQDFASKKFDADQLADELDLDKVIQAEREVEKSPKYAIGTKFTTRHKIPKLCTVVDILKTYNNAGELVKIRYVASHEIAGQTILDKDVVDTTIAMGIIE